MLASLVFLGFSIVIFFISVGVYFYLAPMILGAFFSIADTLLVSLNINAAWTETYNQTEERLRWLVPLIPTVLIFMAIIKILMVASARGRE